MKILGRPTTSVPLIILPSSRMVLTVWASMTESRSWTFLAWGWSPRNWVVAGEAQEVLDPHGRGAQDVALEGDAVHVPGNHLHHRFNPHFQEDFGGGHGTEGSQNTNGEQIRLGVGNDTLGVSLAGLQFKTDGFRLSELKLRSSRKACCIKISDNSVAQGIVQWRPNQATQAFVSYQTFISNHAEIQNPADPIVNGTYYQYQDTSGIARVGLRLSLDDSSELRAIYSHQQTGQLDNAEYVSEVFRYHQRGYTGPAGSYTFFNNM